MVFEDNVLKVVVDKVGRRVVIAFYLVADDFHLFINLFLRIDSVEDDIREQIGRLADIGGGHGGIENRTLLRGIGVEAAAHAL